MSRVSTPRRAAASLVTAATAFLVVLALGSPSASAGDCQNGHLDLLLGRPYSQEKARTVSKAVEIREMTVGRTAVTADYRSDRLNIVVDLKGNLRRADCG